MSSTGAFFLCDKGKVISAYSHKRIRTMPEEGGVTVLSQMDYNDVLIAQGKKLLEEVGWSGLIMLEYLYDEVCHERNDLKKLASSDSYNS